MFFSNEPSRTLERRVFLGRAGVGLGAAALGLLLARDGWAAPVSASPLAPKTPHFAPRAKSVIFLQMCGGPPQIDLFDPKPKLNTLNNQPAPESLYKGQHFAFIKGSPKLLGCPYKFQRQGQSGAMISELLPHIGSVADELCFIKSMHTDQFNHAPAQIFMATGSSQFGHPAMGSWITYGLGSPSQDLPGFVVLVPGVGVDGGKALWNNGFLPAEYQGAEFRAGGDPVLFVNNPPGIGTEQRARSIAAIDQLNELRYQHVGDPEIRARTAAYELAFRMQSRLPELADMGREPRSILDMYGAQPGAPTFAGACLMARRLVEAGVRFVHIAYRGNLPQGIWDLHGEARHSSLEHGLPFMCRQVDRGSAALVSDLKQRGLLDETLVIWGGEFGRTCLNENRAGTTFLGRDHWPYAFTVWLAGGGVKAGFSHGETDDFSFHVTRDAVHIRDLHATVLHLLGIDHRRLTYPYRGLDERLTSVQHEANVIQQIMA